MFERLRNSRTIMAMAGALAVGALFGGSVVSIASPQAAVIYARSASCGGLNFYPATSTQTWGEDGVLRTSNGPVRCNPSLPNGAVVTSLQFTILDNDASGKLAFCGLVRANLTLAGAAPGGYDFLADVNGQVGSGVGSTPGLQRLTDTSVDFANVNTKSFAYYVQCDITDQSNDLGVYGAVVNYNISSTKG